MTGLVESTCFAYSKLRTASPNIFVWNSEQRDLRETLLPLLFLLFAPPLMVAASPLLFWLALALFLSLLNLRTVNLVEKLETPAAAAAVPATAAAYWLVAVSLSMSLFGGEVKAKAPLYKWFTSPAEAMSGVFYTCFLLSGDVAS